MKKSGISIVFAVLLLIWLGIPTAVFAQQNGILKAEVCLMDDYGEVLQDYRTRDFQVENGRFVYRQPPQVEGYTFATANVLQLENEKGSTYRVHYFYTLDDMEPGVLPDPVPLEDMPVKRAPLEQRTVWVSFVDEDLKELTASEERSWDFFWETYELDAPMKIQGYGFQRLETGLRTLQAEELPHFVYVYRKDRSQKAAPSLLFEHRIKDRILPVKSAGLVLTRPEPAATGAQGTASAVTGKASSATSAIKTSPARTASKAATDAFSGESGADTRAEIPPEQGGAPASLILIVGTALMAAGTLLYKTRQK